MAVPGVKYTVEDLERMTPAEQGAAFKECTITDHSKLPARVLERAQARMKALIEEDEAVARDRAS